jgi:hypothetical protein
MQEINISNTRIYKENFDKNKFPDFAQDWV